MSDTTKRDPENPYPDGPMGQAFDAGRVSGHPPLSLPNPNPFGTDVWRAWQDGYMIGRLESWPARGGTEVRLVEGTVSRLELKEGDVLRVTLPAPASHEQLKVIKQQCESLFPNRKVLVCDGGIDLEVVSPTPA